jgi:aconitate hydratase
LKNRLAGGKEGSYTLKFPEKNEHFIYDVAMAYKAADEPLMVLAGREYGAGSSRDWAAKGSNLLGVKAVIARSFERIHRSNLVGMGVLPLVFKGDDSVEGLGLDGTEIYSIKGIEDITPRKDLQVKAVKADGGEVEFTVGTRLDSEIEVDYFKHGGILPYVLRKMIQE